MPIPTVKRRLDLLRRRRDFLAERIRSQTVDPKYDKSEHSTLCWVIRFVEDHYRPEDQFQPAVPGATRPKQKPEPKPEPKPEKPACLGVRLVAPGPIRPPVKIA
jgi:hypothetical protein